MEELIDFLASWENSADGNKETFTKLYEHLLTMEGVTLEFIPRPGITYSLRAKHQAQKKRKLFAMVDVIEDTPRWLSACFYQELTSDPKELGGCVPGGLLGEDAICFDMDSVPDETVEYIKERLSEAATKAAQE